MSKLLEIKDLTVQYETVDGTVHAVEGLNLSLDQGSTLGLVGETGAGKTTAMKAVMQILPQPPARIRRGEIRFEGENLLEKSVREMRKIRGRKISMIFQDPMTSLNPIMTVADQIAEVVELHNQVRKRDARATAVKMLETVGIKADRADDYPHQFSGGMKQRVVIAMALTCSPQLLIADEPTTALDVTIQAQVLELMKKLKERDNTAMILITHDLGIVAETCDNVAIMYAGEVVEYGSLAHIFEDPRHPYTKCLFNCIPDLDSDEETLVPIPGLMPDPSRLPPGCNFCPRCPCAMERCRERSAPITEVTPGHLVKCHLCQEAAPNGGVV